MRFQIIIFSWLIGLIWARTMEEGGEVIEEEEKVTGIALLDMQYSMTDSCDSDTSKSMAACISSGAKR